MAGRTVCSADSSTVGLCTTAPAATAAGAIVTGPVVTVTSYSVAVDAMTCGATVDVLLTAGPCTTLAAAMASTAIVAVPPTAGAYTAAAEPMAAAAIVTLPGVKLGACTAAVLATG
jgi:hypothetical protein